MEYKSFPDLPSVEAFFVSGKKFALRIVWKRSHNLDFMSAASKFHGETLQTSLGSANFRRKILREN
jgi:hypothetical protein